jgi:hypothetical protein
MDLNNSPYLVALWTAGTTFDGAATSAGVSVADYRSFAVMVGQNSGEPSMTGTFDYQLQVKLPGGLPDPGSASTPGTTTTGDVWLTVESGTHDLADGALVIRDTNSPYREVRLIGNFGAPPSHQVNAWVIFKRN